MANGNEGSTPALGDVQARKLLEAPPAGTLKGVRDRAIRPSWPPCCISVSGGKNSAVCGGRICTADRESCIFVSKARAKIRFVPVNAAAQRMIEDYLALTGHRNDVEGVLFRPVNNNRTGRLDGHLDPAPIYQNIVRKYARRQSDFSR
jgi:integrase/recombinase XerD